MDVSLPSLFVMSVDESGQSVYVDQSDASHGFVFDNGELHASAGGGIIKLEAANTTDDDSGSEMGGLSGAIVSDLGDTQLVMMNGLDHFEDSLMQELDSDLLHIDETPAADAADTGNSVLIQLMDIREPLARLRRLLETRHGVDLDGWKFVLQDTQELEAHKTLVDQCVQGEGVVQVNVQLQTEAKRINIIDVLKPAEGARAQASSDVAEEEEEDNDDDEEEEDDRPQRPPTSPTQPQRERKLRPIHEWQVDCDFKAEQERLCIPMDPSEWDVFHVRHWIQWAVREFNLKSVSLNSWSISGAELFKMTIHDFQKIVPNDPGDVFWTHFELLRKMKVVAIIKRDSFQRATSTKLAPHRKFTRMVDVRSMAKTRTTPVTSTECEAGGRDGTYFSYPSGANAANSGQIQLWQFLLELLTTRDYRNVIYWIGENGEFKLNQPERVARLWGTRKNKPTMNYEKLSRALRYYYEGDMISKVQGKRFVYKFECDLKHMLGYSAVELANLVNYGNPRGASSHEVFA